MNSTAIEVSEGPVTGQQRHGGEPFPLVLQFASGGGSPVAPEVADVERWIAGASQALLQQAQRHGAVLFRGFPLRTAQDFDRFVTAFGQPAFTYEDSLSNAVRINRTPRVFTANEAPPSVQIFFHHEMAQTPLYPAKLFFFCEQPAEVGGATPLCRSDVLLERLTQSSPQFVENCARRGLRYCNVMPGRNDPESGMGRSWQSTLKTATKEGAEQRLASLNYTWEWLPDGCLRATTPVLPAIFNLPDGRRTFFNQLIAAYCGWKDARNDPSKAITFGDGTPLDQAAVQTAVELSNELAFDVPWRTGDVALVDNFVVMHGRRPFQGTRKVLAAMI